MTRTRRALRRSRRSNAAQQRVVERSLDVAGDDRVPFKPVHVRIFAANRVPAWLVVVLAAALPRLVVLAVERGSILSAYIEKSDDFARTFVASGTFGFIPGHPSAYTQPLYGLFLIPLYWIFGRHVARRRARADRRRGRRRRYSCSCDRPAGRPALRRARGALSRP